ncbi:Sulfide-quinone reductase [Bathymodiolus heckerae thiotrophic gill symbiont]|uniref:NAD(P)/FAD-dependent oxidoreductase n=1 Tax=Bathymodiolus heckerae thiotrophic gill symbiont TaxID=1052212 RepID=UPI0010B60D14|nr:FAD-dependent oxidoreductase [Bathymodiolus heckerae thiotrophic gill symbiont]CAC9532728.1 Sulfide:quinone oxidoreductase, Type I [uncultured Gammaproteobacteria bacterium]CAC9952170.1 Sulfide:quinone oxidoreductase, Type I [uncultured Gammaproteobacteria bacterium]SHN89180.1 Sulfide-quinone reductase [Bathymodiolus heckerae thiotrophic gill symbiont]
MAHVVVIGASTGGLPFAYDMKKTLGNDHEVTVISNNPNFNFIPSNPWLAVGWRSEDDISFELAPRLERKDINLIIGEATQIKPNDNQVMVGDQVVDYDYLVLATGPKLAFDEVEGLGPEGHSVSICTTAHAKVASSEWGTFCANGGGPIAVGAVQGASCFGPAYEFACIMDTDLKKRGIRDKCPITFITAEPYIGHLGLGGVGDSKGLLESEFRQRHIKWIINAKVTSVTADTVNVDEVNDEGKTIKTHEVATMHTMMLPAFKGVDTVAKLAEIDAGYVNPRGFVMINDYQQSPVKENIFSVGVNIAIPPVEATPVMCGTPKTGYMIESMVTAVVHNIEEMIAGKSPSHIPTWNAVCIADMGDTGAAFVAMPQIPPRNVTWAKKGRMMHLAKIAFEKFFIRNMKTGNSEPSYQKYIFKMLGIERLKKK